MYGGREAVVRGTTDGDKQRMGRGRSVCVCVVMGFMCYFCSILCKVSHML